MCMCVCKKKKKKRVQYLSVHFLLQIKITSVCSKELLSNNSLNIFFSGKALPANIYSNGPLHNRLLCYVIKTLYHSV